MPSPMSQSKSAFHSRFGDHVGDHSSVSQTFIRYDFASHAPYWSPLFSRASYPPIFIERMRRRGLTFRGGERDEFELPSRRPTGTSPGGDVLESAPSCS